MPDDIDRAKITSEINFEFVAVGALARDAALVAELAEAVKIFHSHAADAYLNLSNR